MKTLFNQLLIAFTVLFVFAGCAPPQPEDEMVNTTNLDPCEEDPEAKECSLAILACDGEGAECAAFDPCMDDPDSPECKTEEPCDPNSKECL